MRAREGNTGVIIFLLIVIAAGFLLYFTYRFEQATHAAIERHLTLAAESLPDDPDKAIDNLEQALKRYNRMVDYFIALLMEDNPYLGSDWDRRIEKIIDEIKSSRNNKDELKALKKTVEIELELAKKPKKD